MISQFSACTSYSVSVNYYLVQFFTEPQVVQQLRAMICERRMIDAQISLKTSTEIYEEKFRN